MIWYSIYVNSGPLWSSFRTMTIMRTPGKGPMGQAEWSQAKKHSMQIFAYNGLDDFSLKTEVISWYFLAIWGWGPKAKSMMKNEHVVERFHGIPENIRNLW